MSQLEKILAHNQEFVESRKYEPFVANKYPDRKLAIVSCMDTRMTTLLPAALGLQNGDAKMVKCAGALITHPFGAVMRSLLVSVFDLQVEEIIVVGHYDCGMRGFDADSFLQKAHAAGIPQERIDMLTSAGINLREWLKGFDDVEDSIRHTVKSIRQHPLMPAHIPVHGLVIEPKTGKLTLIEQDGKK
ncbi:beta-class carbonic anhydrase [Kingella negevensis]|uniref:Beta-carbonic anhydrase 1 n=1 Tax=Kingella negevensis TaxID=1522312 RepID=A0A238HHA4_9NEIS|nr:carbonic anhydrase [Kingella negevensis]MDK4679517.1 carbonic anhydrase [Kingella negevensis]MDK4682765.1 carbonic anhydrase [Kingella negevensis]MDK4685083.1 carbonic anhydrase [Kingella negevensis]MDK4688960.1 carbonic anhydrase [Kingella negevensis]MDK4690962.1 carbonic anhydrase [Kingella negevensis]